MGRAIAHRLVAEGACVVVADLDAESAAAVAEELGGSDKAVAVAVDVTDEGPIADAFKAALPAFGGVDPTAGRSPRRSGLPTIPSASCTSSAATPATPCCAS
ncbi:SDR family NAD(P)-dependent oxidoreductase [Streptomyces sp. NPDC020801]|uniref:SDR family NAD(P)-dependent oxidoreductase n=1 Tax=unclassified Streptomyces TaxID=2593676 RepID=UPI0037AB56DC